MPVTREAKYLSGADIGKTVSCFDSRNGDSYTTSIVAVEQWPDATLVHLPADIRGTPVLIRPDTTVTIAGKAS